MFLLRVKLWKAFMKAVVVSTCDFQKMSCCLYYNKQAREADKDLLIKNLYKVPKNKVTKSAWVFHFLTVVFWAKKRTTASNYAHIFITLVGVLQFFSGTEYTMVHWLHSLFTMYIWYLNIRLWMLKFPQEHRLTRRTVFSEPWAFFLLSPLQKSTSLQHNCSFVYTSVIVWRN